MTNQHDPRVRLAALLDACAETIESMDDRELMEETVATGIDATAESNRIRGLLLAGVVMAKRTEIADAARKHQKDLLRPRRVPAVAAEGRSPLMQELEQHPEKENAVPALQSQDVPSFSDADVESALMQLQALGLLGEDDEAGTKQ